MTSSYRNPCTCIMLVLSMQLNFLVSCYLLLSCRNHRRHIISLVSIQFRVLFNLQVDTLGELEMKYNLHECYVQLKQYTDAIHTVRYFRVHCQDQNDTKQDTQYPLILTSSDTNTQYRYRYQYVAQQCIDLKRNIYSTIPTSISAIYHMC